MTNSHRLRKTSGAVAAGAVLAEATLVHLGRTYGSNGVPSVRCIFPAMTSFATPSW
jgi:hypothetical protein